MKINIKNIIAINILCFFIGFSNILASTNTEVRTADDLKIWDSITVTQTVRNAALATPKVDESEKIYDFANLLTEEDEISLYASITSFISKNNMDMVVVTINNNNKSSSMAYADDFYDYNYFGKGNTYDGILMLIDMDNRQVWISTTGQAQLIYDDARIDNMLDYIAPKLTSKDYKGAVDKFIYYSQTYATSGVPSSNKSYYVDDNGDIKKKESSKFFEAFKNALVFAGIGTGIFVIIGAIGHRNVKKATKAGLYLENDSVIIDGSKDTFLNSETTKVRIESSSSSGGGGSSSHRGSSGRSHGGGGRSF